MNSNVENLPPHIIRLVYKEVTTLTADPPDGIKVFPNEEDLTDLQVTIEGPGLLPDQDLPPERGRQWRDLRQRAQEGLDG
ncbi:ubiquitin conjugating enzyme E2 S [Homo sapiens]|uniref:Ubiquitin conjugating enzyme E2 S n=2 Tax=Hominidae TaxID=9604 RepID=K7EM75_HUMAN|nr:ubiquitin conjugating enzyme E2 S [Homo sapiens]KAI4044947.1 ubiquitin conjugating enzyme E2 S [Homo sapiens]PNJ03051.1 UBE2S isoform 3 [Pongo abelii]